jgi:hypothetical protein
MPEKKLDRLAGFTLLSSEKEMEIISHYVSKPAASRWQYPK